MARAAAPAPARLTSPPRDGNGLAQPAQGALNALIDVIAELLLQVRSSPAQPNCSTSPACTNCATGPSTTSTKPKPNDRTGCDRRPRRASDELPPHRAGTGSYTCAKAEADSTSTSADAPVRGRPWKRRYLRSVHGRMTDRSHPGDDRYGGMCRVNRYIAQPGQAVCKTVGLAYVGSNPTPATIKLAGQTRSIGSGLVRYGSGLE
jgi:hypothetical protein